MKNRGFTLVEMLVVVGIIGILVSLAIPNFQRIKDKAKESQVKQNLHSLQLALEQYSTDNQGVYPPWIYGGDFTDSWTISQESWDKLTADDGFELGGQMVTSRPGWCEPAGPGDGDALLEYGYLGEYPRNPFTLTNNVDRNNAPARGPINQRSDGVTSQRDTGGRNNNLMWEISGGPPKNQGLRPLGHPGWKYLYPVYPHDQATNQLNPGGVRETSTALLGNFYYYTVNRDNKSWGDYNPNSVDRTVDPSLQDPPIWVIGYKLVGYGALWNKGTDVYDVYGEFEEHCRTTRTGPDAPVNAGPGGQDGTRDGAIVVLSSGGSETLSPGDQA
ncbi:MAG: type II secretion system protein [bacterium]|jgi:prepilin-type N-terminal cleavage/methylation domain-containing protein